MSAPSRLAFPRHSPVTAATATPAAAARPASFDAQSVMLLAFAALAVSLSAGGSLHAQTHDGALSPVSTPPAVVAQAAPAIPPNRTTAGDVDAAFKRADRNGDGRLSREEAEHFPMLAQRFGQADGNRDGFLSRAEFDAAAGL